MSAKRKTVAEKDLDRAWEKFTSTPEGRLVLLDVLGFCGVYRSAYAGENTNATNFMLGQRDIGARMIARLDQINPTIYPTLLLDQARKPKPINKNGDDDNADQIMD